jgi:hypothetical protein
MTRSSAARTRSRRACAASRAISPPGGGGDELQETREGLTTILCYRGVVPLDINATRRAMWNLEPELNRLMGEDEERGGEGEAGFRRSGEGC